MTATGAIYCRISRDTEGLALGVERQREDCLALAVQHGVNVPAERLLIENDVGASGRSRKPRPLYQWLKELVAAGEVDTVIFYSNSRLTRRMLELEDWIQLHEKTGVRLISKVSGNDDLSTADGRMVARIKASVDEAEADRISERVRRTFEQRRAAGDVSSGGPRPFGFTSSSTRAELVPEEAEAIQAGARLLLAGGTFGEVARDWTARELRPPKAKTWQRETVRSVYRSGRVAGLVTYQRAVVGPSNGPAILDRTTWEAVQEAVQHEPSRPPVARRHVLSGRVFCGTCGATMVVQSDAYRCVPQRQGCGGVKRNKAWLDALVDGYMRQHLEGEAPVDAPPTSSVRADVVENLERKISELREAFEDGRIESEDYFPSLTRLRGRVSELRAQESELARKIASTSGESPLATWEHGLLSERRRLLASLVSGIYVKPVGRIGRAPIPVDSVEILPA